MIAIPAMDILDGQVVRLYQGDYGQVTAYGDPVDYARAFADAGFKRLHLVDLNGARNPEDRQTRLIRSILSEIPEIQLGGGLRSYEDIRDALDSGMSKVALGSVAVSAPDLIEQLLESYSAERIIIAADFSDDIVYTHGWARKSGLILSDFPKQYLDMGITQFLATDIRRDGVMVGPAIEKYQSLLDLYPSLRLIASGGIRSIGDLQALSCTDISYCVVGKAIYEQKISLEKLRTYA